MKIFPAIDIKDKKCVRLVKGDFDNKTEYAMSPVDQAGKYKDHGFKNLHIVDLDGALTGETVNLDIIKQIVSKYDFKIEIGRVFESDFQRLVIADEISPDSCRLWDINSGEKLDKDVFRRDLGNLTDAYSEVAMRLGVIQPTNSKVAEPRLVK